MWIHFRWLANSNDVLTLTISWGWQTSTDETLLYVHKQIKIFHFFNYCYLPKIAYYENYKSTMEGNNSKLNKSPLSPWYSDSQTSCLNIGIYQVYQILKKLSYYFFNVDIFFSYNLYIVIHHTWRIYKYSNVMTYFDILWFWLLLMNE